jgi:hypothetical protein
MVSRYRLDGSPGITDGRWLGEEIQRPKLVFQNVSKA